MERLTEYMGNGENYESINPIDTPYEYGKANLQALINKLATYEDAEEQGLLLRLPCKVGDIVWEINAERKRISKFVIESITIYPCSVIQFNWTLLEGIYKNVVGFSKAELGKTVFLTKEEAEDKLKEMEEKDGK